MGRIYQKLIKKAGMERIRFHDLRHTFATTALEHGMDVKTLSMIIGHVSAATTLDIYTHTTDAMQRSAAVSIDRGIGKAVYPMRAIQSRGRAHHRSTV